MSRDQEVSGELRTRANTLAATAASAMAEIDPVVVPDEILLGGKPAAVSLLAEGYGSLTDIRAIDRDDLLDLDELSVTELIRGTRASNNDRAQATKLGQIIAGSSLFYAPAFAGYRLGHSSTRVGTADSVLLGDITFDLDATNITKRNKKRYAEYCLAAMHGYVSRASIGSNGKNYRDGFETIEVRLDLFGSRDKKLSTSLKETRPDDRDGLAQHLESVVELSQLAVGAMTERAELIRRHESLPARARRRLSRSVASN